MNCLLDTHTFIWSVFEPDLLGSKARNILLDPENTVYVSVVSFWEISLKYALGKLELVKVRPESFPDIAAQMDFEILTLTAKEAASFYQLPRIGHKDPFDRLIIWQAISQKLLLISKDRQFNVYKGNGLKLIW